jgi:phage shock protein B
MEPILICTILFIGLPWIVLHYMSQWKKGRSISTDDEQLLDDLYHISQRLDERIQSIERIMDVDSPEWRRLSHSDDRDMLDSKIEDRERSNIRRIS